MKESNNLINFCIEEKIPCNKRCIDCPDFPLNYLDSIGVTAGTNYIDRKKILIGGEYQRLSHPGYRVLCALSKNINKELSKSYLLKYGWPDEHVVQNNLTVVISELRNVLRNSRLSIENIRGFGYKSSLIVSNSNSFRYQNF